MGKPTLEYARPEKTSTMPKVLAAAGLYLVGGLLSMAVVRPMIDDALFGHAGDSVVAVFCLMSIAVTGMGVAGVCLYLARRVKTDWLWAMAGVVGLLGVVPAYVVLLLFF